MAKTPDDLEAVRTVVAALEGFSAGDQERVIRWAREKLGLALEVRSPGEPQPGNPPDSTPPGEPSHVQVPGSARDLKTFVKAKSPKNDVQFAATVAYFHRFEAPSTQRKEEIDAAILQDATRLVNRDRFKKPLQTLNNAKLLGLLDSGSEPGKFTINTVGENLVAMTLPGEPGDEATRVRRPRTTHRRRKSTGKTKSAKK